MQVVEQAWNTYVTDTGDGPLFISFDDEAAREDLTDTLLHCARVLITIKHPGESGGPASPESEHLWEMEDALCDSLSANRVACRLVARLTFNGVRELVFQLDNWDSFRPPIGVWMQRNSEYEIDVSEEEGWDFFNECIRPSQEDWLFLSDRDVVNKLIELGSDPEKKHTLDFVFRGAAADLKKVASDLKSRGYETLQPSDFNSGEIVLSKKMTLDLQSINAESLAHTKMAADYGIEYDGWGTEVAN